MTSPSAVPSVPVPFSTPGNIRHYKHESTLFVILAVIAVTVLFFATLFTVGLIWLILLWAYVIYLVIASYFVCFLRGNAVKVTPEQFPALYERFCACCQIAGVSKIPDFYLLAGDGMLNAFATRFLNRYYVVLLSDIVDAFENDEEALSFYMGHELGHVAQKHIARRWWLRMAMGMPLIGSAYSRAREYTCDQYGLACCPSVKSAVHAMSVLAAGTRRWRTMNTSAYVAQARETGGFWMSLNELTNDYPWLCKRVARIQSGDAAEFPRRSIWAWIFASMVPRTGLGLIGAVIIYSYFVFIILTMAISLGAVTAFSSLGDMGEMLKMIQKLDPVAVKQEAVDSAYTEAKEATAKIDAFIEANENMPTTLEEAEFELGSESTISDIKYDADADGVVTVQVKEPADDISLVLTRTVDDEQNVKWVCTGGPGVGSTFLPYQCDAQ